MIGTFDNATFGTICETRDGGKAVYLKKLYDGTHRILVEGFENSFSYHPDGKRKGGGKYASKCGPDLDIVKVGD